MNRDPANLCAVSEDLSRYDDRQVKLDQDYGSAQTMAMESLQDDLAQFREHILIDLEDEGRMDALLNLLAFAETDAEVLAHAKSLQSILSSAARSAADKLASEG